MERVAKDAGSYNDFNLVVGNLGKSNSMWYYGTRSKIAQLEGGQVGLSLFCDLDQLYGVGNAVLDTPWYKLVLAKKTIEDILAQDHDHETFVDALFEGEMAVALTSSFQ